MLVASTPKALTVVSASRDTMVTVCTATIPTNAHGILVTRTRFVEIQRVHIAVAATPVSRVMEGGVTITMSAKRVITTVIKRLYALIPGALIAVLVPKDIVEMVKSAKVSEGSLCTDALSQKKNRDENVLFPIFLEGRAPLFTG